jgi:hypothetical protein
MNKKPDLKEDYNKFVDSTPKPVLDTVKEALAVLRPFYFQTRIPDRIQKRLHNIVDKNASSS